MKEIMESIKKLLAELQQLLASADLAQKKRSRSFKIEVARKLDMKFRMEPDHHKRPHMHIQYGKENHKASYALDNGDLLAGSMPTYHEKVIVEWISNHSENLNRLWSTLKEGKDHKAIIEELKAEDD